MPMAEKYSRPISIESCVCGLISEFADSDVLYLNLLGADHIVLNSSGAISDLLDKRSAIYSGRVRGFRTHRSSLL